MKYYDALCVTLCVRVEQYNIDFISKDISSIFVDFDKGLYCKKSLVEK